MAGEAEPALSSLLAVGSIHLTATATDREDAVRQTGRALLNAGAVEAGYIDAMLARERSVSTYVGEGIAIPHGTLAARDWVLRDAIVVLRFPDGVDWQGNDVRVCVGIAALGGGHIALVSRLARVLLEPRAASSLRMAVTEDQVYAILE
ncbi:MAG: system, component (fructose/mannitol) [Microbacteriaceae bacterium]|nr:system, component (fructose/mannitol) [Microbacteriaceae bacterium]